MIYDSNGDLVQDSIAGDTVDDDVLDQSKINVINDTVDEVPVTIKAVASQTANNFDITDSSDANLFHVKQNGRIWSKSGMQAYALQYGGSLMLWDHNGITVEHDITDQAGSYDHTGGTYETLFTDSTNSPFEQSDADDRKWIVIRSGPYIGAMAEINTYIDASNVILHTFGLDVDIISVDYRIIDHPQMVIGDNYHSVLQVNNHGHFDIHSGNAYVGNDYTNAQFEVETTVGADDIITSKFETEAEGFNNVTSVFTEYKSGDIQPGDIGSAIRVDLDLTDASSADSTTLARAIVASVSGETSAMKQAFTVQTGFDEALSVAGAISADMDYGYEVTSGSVADRQAAFSSSGTNVQIFDSASDYILIGDAALFEVINVTLATNSSKDVVLDAYFSTGNGTWSALTIASDGTNGFQNSGQIIFDAPAGWAVSDEAESAADITSAYYIKLVRTYATLIPVLPTESTIHIFSSRDLGMKITGKGFIQPTTGADTAAPNNSIYYSSDQSKLVYKDPGGTVRDLY